MKPLLYALVVVALAVIESDCNHGPQPSSDTSNSAGTENPQDESGTRKDARLLLDRGTELYKDDRDSEAAEAFKEAINIDPTLAEAHYKLGLAYLALGEKREAEDAFNKAVDTYEKYVAENPTDSDAFFNLGEAYNNLHQHEDAIDAYKNAVRLNPSDADAYFELGMAQSKLARYDEAVVSLKKATDLDPDNFRAEDALDKAREDQKRVQAGQKHLEEALKKKEAEANQNNNKSTTSTSSPNPSERIPSQKAGQTVPEPKPSANATP